MKITTLKKKVKLKVNPNKAILRIQIMKIILNNLKIIGLQIEAARLLPKKNL